MFHIAIVDDEKYTCDRLSSIIHKTLFNSTLDYRISMFMSVKDFLENKDDEFELVFLDIIIGEENGVAVSKAMYERGLKSIVVFVTSFDDYMRDAFGLNVYGYVMKEEADEQIPKIIHRVLNDVNKKCYILLKGDMGSITYCYKDIMYFMIENRKCYIQTMKEQSRVYTTTLKGIKLNLNDQFLQPNAKYIVNAQYIKLIKKGSIVMNNGKCIYISRGKYKNFIGQYKKFLMMESDNIEFYTHLKYVRS